MADSPPPPFSFRKFSHQLPAQQTQQSSPLNAFLKGGGGGGGAQNVNQRSASPSHANWWNRRASAVLSSTPSSASSSSASSAAAAASRSSAGGGGGGGGVARQHFSKIKLPATSAANRNAQERQAVEIDSLKLYESQILKRGGTPAFRPLSLCEVVASGDATSSGGVGSDSGDDVIKGASSSQTPLFVPASPPSQTAAKSVAIGALRNAALSKCGALHHQTNHANPTPPPPPPPPHHNDVISGAAAASYSDDSFKSSGSAASSNSSTSASSSFFSFSSSSASASSSGLCAAAPPHHTPPLRGCPNNSSGNTNSSSDVIAQKLSECLSTSSLSHSSSSSASSSASSLSCDDVSGGGGGGVLGVCRGRSATPPLTSWQPPHSFSSCDFAHPFWSDPAISIRVHCESMADLLRTATSSSSAVASSSRLHHHHHPHHHQHHHKEDVVVVSKSVAQQNDITTHAHAVSASHTLTVYLNVVGCARPPPELCPPTDDCAIVIPERGRQQLVQVEADTSPHELIRALLARLFIAQSHHDDDDDATTTAAAGVHDDGDDGDGDDATTTEKEKKEAARFAALERFARRFCLAVHCLEFHGCATDCVTGVAEPHKITIRLLHRHQALMTQLQAGAASPPITPSLEGVASSQPPLLHHQQQQQLEQPIRKQLVVLEFLEQHEEFYDAFFELPAAPPSDDATGGGGGGGGGVMSSLSKQQLLMFGQMLDSELTSKRQAIRQEYERFRALILGLLQEKRRPPTRPPDNVIPLNNTNNSNSNT